jgi:hypothetical protein
MTVTEAEAIRLGSTTLAAFTVTVLSEEGGTAGAVYKPEPLSMLPQAAPPAAQLTDQVAP